MSEGNFWIPHPHKNEKPLPRLRNSLCLCPAPQIRYQHIGARSEHRRPPTRDMCFTGSFIYYSIQRLFEVLPPFQKSRDPQQQLQPYSWACKLCFAEPGFRGSGTFWNCFRAAKSAPSSLSLVMLLCLASFLQAARNATRTSLPFSMGLTQSR